MLGDLDRLHARAEAHRRIRLRQAAHHAARDAADKGRGAEVACVKLGFGGHEEEYGTLGRGLNPRPGDQALVNWQNGKLTSCAAGLGPRSVLTPKNTATLPNASDGAGEAVFAVRGHGSLCDFERLLRRPSAGVQSLL